jgi:hypothetical protein
MTRLAAIAALALFLATSAYGQGMPLICQPHAKIKAFLTEKQQEVLIGHGLAGSALLELYANREGQWTILIMRPDMAPIACIQGAGTDFALTGNKFPPPKADPA